MRRHWKHRNEQFVTDRHAKDRRHVYGPTHHVFMWKGSGVGIEDVGSRPGSVTFPVFDPAKIPKDILLRFERAGCTHVHRHTTTDGKVGYTGSFRRSDSRWLRILIPNEIYMALRYETTNSHPDSLPTVVLRALKKHVDSLPVYAAHGRETASRWREDEEKWEKDHGQ